MDRAIRAREGDLKAAVSLGMRALHGERKSLPSLLMVSRDLTEVLNEQYSGEAQTRDYLDQLAELTAVSAGASLTQLNRYQAAAADPYRWPLPSFT